MYSQIIICNETKDGGRFIDLLEVRKNGTSKIIEISVTMRKDGKTETAFASLTKKQAESLASYLIAATK